MVGSEVDSLGKNEGIVHLDPEVPDGALQLRVAEQEPTSFERVTHSWLGEVRIALAIWMDYSAAPEADSRSLPESGREQPNAAAAAPNPQILRKAASRQRRKRLLAS